MNLGVFGPTLFRNEDGVQTRLSLIQEPRKMIERIYCIAHNMLKIFRCVYVCSTSLLPRTSLTYVKRIGIYYQTMNAFVFDFVMDKPALFTIGLGS